MWIWPAGRRLPNPVLELTWHCEGTRPRSARGAGHSSSSLQESGSPRPPGSTGERGFSSEPCRRWHSGSVSMVHQSVPGSVSPADDRGNPWASTKGDLRLKIGTRIPRTAGKMVPECLLHNFLKQSQNPISALTWKEAHGHPGGPDRASLGSPSPGGRQGERGGLPHSPQ